MPRSPRSHALLLSTALLAAAVAAAPAPARAERLGNLYRSYQLQLEEILQQLGLGSVRELRGRTDLLLYRGREAGR